MDFDNQELATISSDSRFESTRKLIKELDELISSYSGREREFIQAARDLSLTVHCNQAERKDGTPYVNHPLRVAINLFTIIDRPHTELVSAALLHDALEDQCERLVAELSYEEQPEADIEDRAFDLICDFFGLRVAEIVALLSHDKEPSGDKNLAYREYVKKLFERDPEAFLVKLSDFSDNALKIDAVTDTDLKVRLQRKYGPVLKDILVLLDAVPERGHALSLSKNALQKQMREVYADQYSSVFE